MRTTSNIRTTLITLFFLVCTLIVLFAPFDSVFAQGAQAIEQAAQNGGNANAQPREAGIGIMSAIGSRIGNFILYIGSYITGLGGWLLDASINRFVLNVGALLGNGSSLGNAISTVWVLIRDICNLAFIFGFIYVGIRTIIDADSSATKRMLASIIIGALLINFSLFIAKGIIEVSNYLSYQIYNNLVVNSTGTSNIAQAFLDRLGLSTIYNPENVKEFADRTAGGNISFYFMGTLMLIIAGFVLAAGAILLMIRFVALVLILCFSPILFAATVFPATQKYASELWHKLLSYSFFAPAYLLLLVVSLYVLGGVVGTIRGTGSNANAANALSGVPQAGATPGVNDGAGVFLAFGVAIFFLIMSLRIATSFGIAGAERTIAFGNSLRGKVQSAVGRNTIGRASASLLKDYDKINAGAKQTRTGRFMGRALKYGSLGMLDDRNIRGTLEAGKKSKFGGSYSHADDVTYATDQKKRQAATIKQRDFESTIDNRSDLQKLFGVKSPADLLKKDMSTLTDEQKKERAKLESAIINASTKQLEELEQEQRLALVSIMTQSQLDALNKSDNLTEVEKDEINDKRSGILKEKYGSKDIDVAEAQKKRDTISKANVDDLSALGLDFLKDEKHAVRLTGSQMDDLKKKMAPTEYKQVSDAREAALKKLAEDLDENIDGKSAQNHILRMKATDMSKLPKDVLLELAPLLPTSTLVEIAKQSTLNADDQRNLRERINEYVREAANNRLDDDGRQRLESLNDFFNTNPYGKQFGR
jgi:hypothetical protein